MDSVDNPGYKKALRYEVLKLKLELQQERMMARAAASGYGGALGVRPCANAAAVKRKLGDLEDGVDDRVEFSDSSNDEVVAEGVERRRKRRRRG